MRAAAALAALLLAFPLGAVAQGAGTAAPLAADVESAAPGAAAILTIDQDALYRRSAWGQRADADLAARSQIVATENDRIAAELEAEDDRLTALRDTMPAEEFSARADAFDRRVQQTRKERDEAARALMDTADADRSAFFNAALPVFTRVMAERGALAILERRSVFLATPTIDITDVMIARVDADIGAGPAETDQAAPATPEASDQAPSSGQPQNDSATEPAMPGSGSAGQDAAGTGAPTEAPTLP